MTVRAIAEMCGGVEFNWAAYQDDPWLTDLVWLDQLSREERLLLAPDALAVGRPQHRQDRVSRGRPTDHRRRSA